MSDSIGQRICIIGLSASGKSTLANAIASKKKLNLLHMDQIGHIPNTNWQQAPFEEWSAKHDEFIKKDNWVIDGSYKRTIPQRFTRADTVIFIKMNRFGCVYRFMKRTLLKKDKRYGKLEGALYDCNLEMIKYILFNGPRKFSIYEEAIKSNPHLKVISLHSFAEINKLVESL